MFQFLKNKNILITGGCGFIGSNLAHFLVESGANITILDSMIADYGGNLFNIHSIKNKININFSDMRDIHSMKYLVKEKDIIFNLAGQVSHIDSMKDPLTDLDINSRSQLTFLEACRLHNPKARIVFASTRQIYGIPNYLPVNEDHPINPIDINGVNKYSAEKLHSLYHKVYGIKTTSLRLTNVYGPKQLIKHNKQGFTGIFVREAIQGNTINLYGTGNQKRDFNYVSDVCEAFILAAIKKEAVGQIYNLGFHTPYSLTDFVSMLKKHCSFSYKKQPFPNEKKKIDIGSYYADYSKINNELGWTPRIDLDQGLKLTVDFYKKNINHYL